MTFFVVNNMNKPTDTQIRIFKLFFDEEPLSCETINSSRGDSDFREALIFETIDNKYVVKLADNDFTFPEKIFMWKRTVEEYRKLGYYCPDILSDRSGSFPEVSYMSRNCIAYAEEYSKFKPSQERSDDSSERDPLYESYMNDIWVMTAKIADKRFDYTDYPSAYCLFEKFCPSDECDEVLENALKWIEYARSLPSVFQKQVERIWSLWIENRNKLEKIYPMLPTSVFQADLNSTNILLDENKKFVGVYDFNLCGKDVFLNYLIRESPYMFEDKINWICNMLKTVSNYYKFSELEKDTVLMLYRCLVPLWISCLYKMKELKDNIEDIKLFLDKTEYYLTEVFDFKSFMN